MKNYDIVIQINVKNWQASEENEITFRHNLEKELDELFKKSLNGFCDGGQMGGLTMEIFMFDVLNIDLGMELTLSHLKSKQMKADYKVLWRVSGGTDPFKIAFSTTPAGLARFDWFYFE